MSPGAKFGHQVFLISAVCAISKRVVGIEPIAKYSVNDGDLATIVLSEDLKTASDTLMVI